MKIGNTDIKYLIQSSRERGFFHLLSANVLIQVFAFASQLFVAGILSPDDVGRIKLIQTYLSIFSVLAGMGFNASTLKICSEGRTEQENARFFNAALFFTLISTAIVYAGILLVNALGLLSKDVLLKAIIPLGLFPVVTHSLFMLFIAYFQAKKEIKVFSSLTVWNKLLSIVAIIIFTWFLGIRGYYYAFNLSYILMLVAAFILIKKTVKFDFRGPFRKPLKEHWKYARSAMFSNIVGETSAYVDMLLIGFLIKDMNEIGYYGFALTMTIALRIFPGTVQQITVPYFSSFKSRKTEFMQIFKRYNRLLYIVVIGSLLVFVVLAPPLLDWVFNGKYESSIPYLMVLSIGWSIRNLNQLQSGAIFGLGKIHYNAMVALSALIANVIMVPVLVYFFGVMGAAYASLTGGIVIWGSSRYYFRKAVAKADWDEVQDDDNTK